MPEIEKTDLPDGSEKLDIRLMVGPRVFDFHGAYMSRIHELTAELSDMVSFFDPYAWGSDENRSDALRSARAVLKKEW